MEQEILQILQQIKPAANFAASADFIADKLLDSFDITTLVARLDDAYDVEITVADLLPENFGSAAAMAALVTRLQDED